MKKNTLDCSVIIPVHNAEKYLEQTLNSVINQTVKNIEIICIDDCSTDNSLEILKKIKELDNRIIILQNEKNLKVSATRNKGVNYSNAEWVALLDSDDKWENNFLEECIKRKNETRGDLICSSCKYITDDNVTLDQQFIIPSKISYKMLLKQNKILCSSVFIKKELLINNPFYADDVHEDYLCWLSILKNIKFAYGIEKPLLIYRLTKGSKSRNKFKAVLMSYKTYRKHGLNFFTAIFYTLCNIFNGIKKYSKIR